MISILTQIGNLASREARFFSGGAPAVVRRPRMGYDGVRQSGLAPGCREMCESEEKEMLFVCYPKCSTCKKAQKWLEENGKEFEIRDIRTENPTAEELREWREKSGLPLKRFFNTSGNLYKEMKLKDRLPEMGEEEQIALLATDGMLVKRPILIDGDTVLTGFREKEWKEKLI